MGNSRAATPDGPSHPLAKTASQVKRDQASSAHQSSGCVGRDQPGSSRQHVSLSEELLDFFESIQQVQREVSALPQPQDIPSTAGTQSGPSSDQVLQSCFLHLILLSFVLFLRCAFVHPFFLLSFSHHVC